MEPLLKISIKAAVDKKSKKHQLQAAQHRPASSGPSRRAPLPDRPATSPTQELFGPSPRRPVLDACLDVLRPPHDRPQPERLLRGNAYHRLETFRRLAMDTAACESGDVYEYISGFVPEDDSTTNQFLEILADFLLTTSYSLRHRPVRMLGEGRAMPMLHRCVANAACQHNALVVVCILSHCPEIRGQDLAPVIALVGEDLEEPARRLCYRILANLAAHKYLFTRSQVEAIRRHVEPASPKDPDAARDTAAIAAHIDSISASLDAYLEGLRRGDVEHAIEREFWAQNAQRISADARAVFSLFCSCLARGDKRLLLGVCYDLVCLLRLQPTLCTHAIESGIPDILLHHINSSDEDIGYAAVQLLSAVTQCSLQPGGPP